MPHPRHVLVYTRKGCHLCEIVKESLVKLERRGLFRWQEVDVDADDQLRRQFTDEEFRRMVAAGVFGTTTAGSFRSARDSST